MRLECNRGVVERLYGSLISSRCGFDSRRRNQRGFGWLAVIPYLVGGLAVVGAITYVYQLVDNSWATDAGIAEGRKRAEAELQPPLDACNASLKAQGELIATQNSAVKAHKALQDAKIAKATQGMQAARSVAQAAQTEAARLREAILAPVGEGCPAAEAVRKVREGLAQ